MKIAVMQPYFFPYIGYFQLMSAVDRFVLFDNVQYVRQGWINRNRILLDGQPGTFTLPLKKASRFLNINCRTLSEEPFRTRLLNQLHAAYRHAPYANDIFPILEEIVEFESSDLFAYLHHSLKVLKRVLSLKCELLISSEIDIDPSLRAQDKILEICRSQRADTYINLPGGRALYSAEAFAQQGMTLHFIQPDDFHYPQYGEAFVPWLSIIDVMMFNSKNAVIGLCQEKWSLN